jgi:hypothetical protein
MAVQPTDASRFINLVAQQFDQRYFPNTQHIPLRGGKETGPSSIPTPIEKLPKELQVEIYEKASNFSNWINTTRFVETPLAHAGLESVRRAAIELSAKNLLIGLHQPLGYIKPYSEQLLTFVFQEAFNRLENDRRADTREEMIKLARSVQPQLDSLPFAVRRTKYKVEAYVTDLLNYFVVQAALAYLGYRVSGWVQRRAYHLLSQTVIPRGVNFLINHAHLHVIRVVSGAVALVQFAYFYYKTATVIFWIAKLGSQSLHPRLYQAMTVVESFAFFPSKAITYLTRSSFKLFTSSWSMQSSLAANLNAMKEVSRAKYYEDGGMQAYQAWMILMQGGVQTIGQAAAVS